MLNKKLLLHRMDERIKILQDRTDRDFSGGLQSDLFALRELKYWKEAIERKEFDIRIW